jgi:CheY-like chemotaxis protein
VTVSIAARQRSGVGSLDPSLRPLRRCVRCGREGRNAFRPMRGTAPGAAWLCAHAEPCHERARLRQRAAAKRAQGRPVQSPISGWSLDERRVLVLSADPESRTALQGLLSDVASADVECLGLDRRSIELLGRREFGMVVVDVRRGDPVAILNGLARRLSRLVWRGVPVVLIRGVQDDGPAIEALAQTATYALARPVEPDVIVSIVNGLATESTSARAG